MKNYLLYFLYFVKDIFLYAKQVVHLALPPVRLPILHLRLPSVATMESVFPRKSHKKNIKTWWEITGKYDGNLDGKDYLFFKSKILWIFSLLEIQLSCYEKHQEASVNWRMKLSIQLINIFDECGQENFLCMLVKYSNDILW